MKDDYNPVRKPSNEPAEGFGDGIFSEGSGSGISETDYLLQGKNGKRLKESIGQIGGLKVTGVWFDEEPEV